MPEDFIAKLTFSKMLDLVNTAVSKIIISSVNLHIELATALYEAAKKGVTIKAIIDPAEDNYRNGFGDIKSIKLLVESGIEIFEVEGNQVSFIIADNSGFIFFPQSRIFIDEPAGPNALKMDAVFRQKIIAYYFPPKTQQDKAEFENTLIDAASESKKELASIAVSVKNENIKPPQKPLDTQKLKDVVVNLKSNPPIQPDLKRKINTYTAKVQFVELKFEGAKLHTKKIDIPKEALPYKDASLKDSLETKLKLFTEIENNSDIQKFKAIADKLDQLRLQVKFKNVYPETLPPGVFLIPITCRPGKSIIKVSEKAKLKEKIQEIEKNIEEFRKSTLESLEGELLNRKRIIRSELENFLRENPPEEYRGYNRNLFSKKIEDKSQGIVASIEFPEVADLVSNVKLIYNFYDLTFEDFKDKKLIEEFRMKGILQQKELDEIDEIVTIRDGFEAAK